MHARQSTGLPSIAQAMSRPTHVPSQDQQHAWARESACMPAAPLLHSTALVACESKPHQLRVETTSVVGWVAHRMYALAGNARSRPIVYRQSEMPNKLCADHKLIASRQRTRLCAHIRLVKGFIGWTAETHCLPSRDQRRSHFFTYLPDVHWQQIEVTNLRDTGCCLLPLYFTNTKTSGANTGDALAAITRDRGILCPDFPAAIKAVARPLVTVFESGQSDARRDSLRLRKGTDGLRCSLRTRLGFSCCPECQRQPLALIRSKHNAQSLPLRGSGALRSTCTCSCFTRRRTVCVQGRWTRRADSLFAPSLGR